MNIIFTNSDLKNRICYINNKREEIVEGTRLAIGFFEAVAKYGDKIKKITINQKSIKIEVEK